MNYVLQKPIYADELAECPGREWINGMCVVAGEDDEVLLSIINKSIDVNNIQHDITFITKRMHIRANVFKRDKPNMQRSHRERM
jgi:hypothetical protein